MRYSQDEKFVDGMHELKSSPKHERKLSPKSNPHIEQLLALDPQHLIDVCDEMIPIIVQIVEFQLLRTWTQIWFFSAHFVYKDYKNACSYA